MLTQTRREGSIPTTQRRAYGFLSALSGIILYWFWPEIQFASIAFNDGIVHVGLVRKMDEVWANGGNVLDFWLPTIAMGHALIRSYQFLMHLSIWTLHRTIFFWMPLERCFNASIALLAASLPWTFFFGARLMGHTVLEAAATAVAAVLLREKEGYGIALGNATFSGYGTYTQLMGTILFPLAIGWSHQGVRRCRYAVRASVAFALCFMSNIMMGYLAFIWILIDAALAGVVDRIRWQRIVIHLITFGAWSLLWMAHWILPILKDRVYQHRSPFEKAYKWNGHGAQKMLHDYFTGLILDGDRFPALTLAACAGLAVCLWAFWTQGGRNESDAPRVRRNLAIQTVLWIGLSFGPATWGNIARVLPFSYTLHWHRFFAATQIAFTLCVGVWAGACWNWCNSPKRTRWARLSCYCLAMGLLFPCIAQMQVYYRQTNATRHTIAPCK